MLHLALLPQRLGLKRALRTRSTNLHRVHLQTRRIPLQTHAVNNSHFPFNEENYVRTKTIKLVESQPDTGYLLFLLEDGATHPDHDGLIISIGGDTYIAISHLIAGRQSARPLSIDLLYSILERCKEINDWSIVRVAVTGIIEETFLGRIFLGNKESGEIAFDIECRPSDATWLAIKEKAPVYINRSVWHENSAPLGELFDGTFYQNNNYYFTTQTQTNNNSSNNNNNNYEEIIDVDTFKLNATEIMTTIHKNEPETVKRLKMELRVALHEEDFTTAARIRDHPYMKMHVAAVTARAVGDVDVARRYEKELLIEIERMDMELRRHQHHHNNNGEDDAAA